MYICVKTTSHIHLKLVQKFDVISYCLFETILK